MTPAQALQQVPKDWIVLNHELHTDENDEVYMMDVVFATVDGDRVSIGRADFWFTDDVFEPRTWRVDPEAGISLSKPELAELALRVRHP